MSKRLFLYTDAEKQQRDNILSYVARLLNEAGVNDLENGITPEQKESFKELLKSEKTEEEITKDANLLSRKWFLIKYYPSYEEIENVPGDHLPDDVFILNDITYKLYTRWVCVYSDTIGLGISKSFDIERDSEACELLSEIEIKSETLPKEKLSRIRKILGLEDYSFTYALDNQSLHYLASHILSDIAKEIEEDRKAYKTKAKAKATANVKISHIKSGKIPVITEKNYQYGLSFYPEGKAYLAPPLTDTSDLKMEEGKIFFVGDREATETDIEILTDPNEIISIDTSLLNPFYKIALDEFQANNNLKEILEDGKKINMQDVYNIYLPDYNDRFGGSSRMHEEDIEGFIKKVSRFNNIVGILITKPASGKPKKSYYPLFTFQGYDAETGVFAFSTPYMNKLILKLAKASVRKTKTGKIKKTTSGSIEQKPVYSYLVDPSIQIERNRDAVRNVNIIVTVIETAGSRPGTAPHISAKTIIDRNPQLEKRLNNSKNPNQLLKRVFIKTWELLNEKTSLSTEYLNIELPDPNNPKNIPTMKTLDRVFTFKHEGKISKKGGEVF